MPGGLEPFEQMGLWARLDDVSHIVIERLKLYANGKFVVELEFPKQIFGRYRPRWVSQPELLEMLVGEAALFPNFKLLRDCKGTDNTQAYLEMRFGLSRNPI